MYVVSCWYEASLGGYEASLGLAQVGWPLVIGHISIDSRDIQWKNRHMNLFQLGDSGSGFNENYKWIKTISLK